MYCLYLVNSKGIFQIKEKFINLLNLGGGFGRRINSTDHVVKSFIKGYKRLTDDSRVHKPLLYKLSVSAM